MCDQCFIRSVSGKLRKLLQADIYRINSRHGVHRILVAYNGNTSSLACLDMIMNLLKSQLESSGKQGFEVVVLNIKEVETEETKAHFKALNDLYHDKLKYRVVDINSFLLGTTIRRLSIDKKFNPLVANISDENYTLEDIIRLIPDKSSLQDFLDIIYTDIITRQAGEMECGTIIYGHSMTKLSSVSLSHIIKGRGSNINDKINDTTINGIHIKHPMRELFDNELEYYTKITTLDKLVLPLYQQANQLLSTINKNLTVNQLTDKYLQQIEVNGYSSTIPTVVKISEKLVAPSKFAHETNPNCRICHQIIYQSPKYWLNKITENDPEELTSETEKGYLQQYQESLEASGAEKYQFGDSDIDVCYGCMVSINGIKSDGFLWPVNREDSKVLEEYIIDEDSEEE